MIEKRITTGAIRLWLYYLLRKKIANPVWLKPVFLVYKVLRTHGVKGHLFGPGDQLTLTHVFQPKTSGTLGEELLAARSLTYSKLIEMEDLIFLENEIKKSIKSRQNN
jgi:hypothetical protein